MQAPFLSGAVAFEISKPSITMRAALNTKMPLPSQTESERRGLVPALSFRPISATDLSTIPQLAYVPGATFMVLPGVDDLMAVFKSENWQPFRQTVGPS